MITPESFSSALFTIPETFLASMIPHTAMQASRTAKILFILILCFVNKSS